MFLAKFHALVLAYTNSAFPKYASPIFAYLVILLDDAGLQKSFPKGDDAITLAFELFPLNLFCQKSKLG